jgi:hypothetical protein
LLKVVAAVEAVAAEEVAARAPVAGRQAAELLQELLAAPQTTG